MSSPTSPTPSSGTAKGRAGMTDRDTRRLSFGSVAADSDRYRPPLPPQALDWLIPRDAAAILDLAAGTGTVTRVGSGGPADDLPVPARHPPVRLVLPG